MAEKLIFDIEVGKNDLSRNLDLASSKAQTINDTLGKTPSNITNITKSTNGLSSSFGALGSAISSPLAILGAGLAVGITAFNKLVDISEESIKAFSEQEDALNRLNQSLKSTGDFSEATVKGVTDFSTELQKNSVFADEAIVSQVAYVRSLGATTETAKKVVQAAADMSAVLGGSLEENVQKLGLTLSGTEGRLGKLIPELKSLTFEQLQAGDAADIVNKKFGGASASELNTYSGKVKNVKNQYNDLQEEIGRLLVKNDAVASSTSFLGRVFGTLAEKLKGLNDQRLGENQQETAFDKATRKASELTAQIEELRQKEKELKEQGLTSQDVLAISRGGQSTLDFYTAQLKSLINQKQIIEADLESGRIKQRTPQKETVDRSLSTEQKKQLNTLNADLLTSQENADQEKLKQIRDTETERTRIADELFSKRISDDNERFSVEQQIQLNKQLADIESTRLFEVEKAKIAGDAAFEKINQDQVEAIRDAEGLKIIQEEKLAILKANQNAELQILQKKNEVLSKASEKSREKELKDQETFLNTAATLSSAKNKELAAIGKAAAITQIAIKTPPAIASSFEFGTKLGGPPLGFAFGAIAATAMAAQAANIAGVGLAGGGVVGGEFNGAAGGSDNVSITARKDELFLNGQQQKNLFDAINSGNLGSRGDIVIQINSREIARAVRDEVQGGFRLA